MAKAQGNEIELLVLIDKYKCSCTLTSLFSLVGFGVEYSDAMRVKQHTEH